MTIVAQAVHVIRKDLTEFNWIFVAFVTLSLAAALSELPTDPSDNTLDFIVLVGPFLLWWISMAIVAIVVQSDSPVKPDAFWQSHAIAPWAVLAAKFILIMFVISGALLAMDVSKLAKAGLTAVEIVPALKQPIASMLLSGLVYWLLSAVTPNFKLFMLGAIVMNGISYALISGHFTGSAHYQAAPLSQPAAVLQPLRIVPVACGLVICLLLIYRKRSAFGVSLMPVAVFALPFAQLAFAPVPVSPLSSLGAAPGIVSSTTVIIDSVIVNTHLHSNTDSTEMGIAFHLNGDTLGHRLALHEVEISLTSGAAKLLHQLRATRPIDVNNLDIALDTATHFVGPRLHDQHPVSFSLSDTLLLSASGLQAGTQVVLTAQMIVYQAEFTTHPAGDTVMFKRDAANFRLLREDSAGAPRWIFTEAGNYGYEPLGNRFDSTEFALVNRKHGDALRMHSRDVGSQSTAIATSGFYRASFKTILEPLTNGISRDPSVMPDAQWMRDADMTMVHWVPKYRYPVRATYTVPAVPKSGR